MKVVFLLNPGKTNCSLAENYRPISLTSFMLKTIEKLIDRYLRDEPLSKIKIHDKQDAYQSGKSTENALQNLVQNIELSLAYEEFALGCFIDISGAFNHLTYLAIKRACHKFKIDPGITGWIQAMLHSRLIFVHCGTSIITVTVSKGCPQGGVFPPLLWCLVVNELLTILNDRNFQTERFSDDLATLLRGRFLGR